MSMTIEDMTGDELGDLLERTFRPQGFTAMLGSQGLSSVARRRKEFTDRYNIQTDEYDYLIRERIFDTHHLSDTQMEMARWACGFFNPQKRIVRRMAVAYKRRPQRRIEGASKTDNRKWTELMRECQWDARAPDMQRYSVAMNRVIVLVVPRKDADGEPVIDFDLVTGSNAEVHREPGTPIDAPPGVLCMRLPTKSWNPEPGEPVCCTVDARWWIWWDAQKNPVRIVEHGLGMFPGADMRSTRPPDTDWWDPHSGRGVTRTVAEVGMIAASMGWTRKQMCRKMLGLITESESDEVPDGQVMVHPEKPFIASGQGVKVVVEDLDQAVDNFLKHIRALQDEAAELVTGAVSTLVDPDPDKPGTPEAGAHQHAAMEEVREMQVLQLEVFERRLNIVVAKTATKIHHPLAIDPDKVKEGFRTTWPRLPFLDSPLNRQEIWERKTTFGTADQVSALMEEEGISEEEAEERLMHIAKRRAKLDEFRAARNQTADPNAPPTTVGEKAKPGESLPQTQGRAGGQASGEARA